MFVSFRIDPEKFVSRLDVDNLEKLRAAIDRRLADFSCEEAIPTENECRLYLAGEVPSAFHTYRQRTGFGPARVAKEFSKATGKHIIEIKESP